MIVVCMPVYNEEDGIVEFLHELQASLKSFEPQFVIVDDHSSDKTPLLLKRFELNYDQVLVLSNSENSGHGFSVMRGLDAAVALNPTLIVTCDGDGQFNGSEIASLIQLSLNSGTPIVEGVRYGRDEPWFRRLTSFATRVIVRVSSGKCASDANTPLRVITLSAAVSLQHKIPKNCPVPNLAISALARSSAIEVCEVAVQSRPPRRNPSSGNHWKQKYQFLPSMRFLRFVLKALIAWLAVHRLARSLAKSRENPKGRQSSEL